MLMTADVAHSPLSLPSVTAPTPAEKAALVTWGQQIAAGLAASLAELGLAACSCSVTGPPLIDPPPGAEDEAVFWWGQAAPDWQLRLAPGAGEDLLANALGCNSLAGDYPLSDTDRALLDLQCQKIGEQVSRRLGLPAPAQHAFCPAASGTTPPGTPVAQFPMRLALHGRTHLARLFVSLDLIRPSLPCAPPQAQTLDRALLAGAEVTLQAVLQGPTLTAGQLLGLEAGDIICLGQGGQDALLQVQSVTIGKGRPGARAGRLAVNVTDISTCTEARHHGS